MNNQFNSGKAASPAGDWELKMGQVTLHLTLNPDGTGSLNGAPIWWQLNQSVLMVNDGTGTTVYQTSITTDSLTLEGVAGQPRMTFQRPGPSRERTAGIPPETGSGGANLVRQPADLVGTWRGPDGLVEIKADNSMTINGIRYLYRVQDNLITVTGNDGSIQAPFRVDGETLYIEVYGRQQTLQRIQAQAAQTGGGSIQADLAGKWCYLSSTNTYSGSRMSNACLTLYPDGTFQYYGESATSVETGSATSQQSDSGTWTATESSITAHSRTRGTKTYSLRKMNHPKNGDAMLVLDGQWFVTAVQRRPW
jgi:hypothetical protein